MDTNNAVTVIIPVGKTETERNFLRTISSVTEAAHEDIEVLFMVDGWELPEHSRKVLSQYNNVNIYSSPTPVGQRVLGNIGAEMAKGKYIFRIDAHCKMSDAWDVKLKQACSEKSVLVCVIESLIEETWESKKNKYTFVYLTQDGRDKWWGNYHGKDDAIEVQPTMALTGCGWFLRKDYYLKDIRADESLGAWGGIGPEVALKTKHSGGTLLLHKGVSCGHVFNTNKTGYSISMQSDARKKLAKTYSQALIMLALEFKPVPTWEWLYDKKTKENAMYETQLVRQDKSELKDSDGKVIKKIIKVYKPIDYKGEKSPDIPEVGREATKNAKLDKIKIAKLNSDGKWEYSIIEGEDNVAMWLFENE